MRYRFVALVLGASLLLCGPILWKIGEAIPCCRFVALGDLDGDGDLDAFLANGRDENTEPNRVWINDGSGRFRDSGQRLGNNDSNSVALGDLFGDGDLDALLSNAWCPPGGEVLENDGQGRFIVHQRLSTPEGSGAPIWAVALADLDDDGDLDAFLGGCCGAAKSRGPGTTPIAVLTPYNMVWVNDGTGRFQNSRQRLGVLGSYDVALGDLDGDDDMDAFVANWPEEPDTVWMNDGGGQFTDSGQRLGGLRGLTAALGDLDSDGDLDAFVGNNGPDEVWLNDGGLGSFSNSGQALGDARTGHVVLGDVDGDGDLDALVGKKDGAAEIWLNDGNLQEGTPGIFVDSGQRLSSSYFNAVTLGDVDGDGDLDAVVGKARKQPAVWLNDGAGRFVSRDRPWIWAALVMVSALSLWWFRGLHQPPEPAAHGD